MVFSGGFLAVARVVACTYAAAGRVIDLQPLRLGPGYVIHKAVHESAIWSRACVKAPRRTCPGFRSDLWQQTRMIMEIFSHWGVRIFIFRMHYEDYISISPTIFINGAVFSLSAKYPTIHGAIICSPIVINYDRHVFPNKRCPLVFRQRCVIVN